MNIDAIERGTNPPEDINVVIEVLIGGEPGKWVKIRGMHDVEAARKMILEAIARA